MHIIHLFTLFLLQNLGHHSRNSFTVLLTKFHPKKSFLSRVLGRAFFEFFFWIFFLFQTFVKKDELKTIYDFQTFLMGVAREIEVLNSNGQVYILLFREKSFFKTSK